MRYPVTPDGRYFVVRGRLWRMTNPALSEELRVKWVKELSAARAALRRTATADRAAACRKVDRAKRALGERGPVWWADGAPDYNRRLAKNTPYREWFEGLSPEECLGKLPG
jgi:hypothetical protein